MRNTILYIILFLVIASCGKKEVAIGSGNLLIQFNESLYSRVSSRDGGSQPLMKNFSASEYVEGKGFIAKDFPLNNSTESPYEGPMGHGKQWTLTGHYKNESI